MKALIIEDEQPAARRLQHLLLSIRPEAKVVGMLDSVESALRWFEQNPMPNLVFLDIQLADGLSFDIFRETSITAPVIFTTAYDQYTLKAFKLNSVDYLLKPIDSEELKSALDKFGRLFEPSRTLNPQALEKLIQSFQKPEYKERFIVKVGQQLTFIQVSDIQYFYSEDGLLFAQMKDKRRHALDYTLDQLEGLLDPSSFFRVNRKVITQLEAIQKIAPYFNSRLAVELRPKTTFEVIVSRDRVSDFKGWLDR